MEIQPQKTKQVKKATLIEGEDYYIEDGKWVFTGNYLKKRGYCCKNHCRHCPYTGSTSLFISLFDF